MAATFDFYAFRINYVTDVIKTEVEFFDRHKYHDQYPVKDYLLYLKTRIGLNPVVQPTYKLRYWYQPNDNLKKLNMDEYAKDMDVMTFKRPWIKLKEFHKIMKVKEYVSNLVYPTKCKEKLIEKNRAYVIKKLIYGLQNKKFAKHKSEITYDSDLMQITAISCLSFDKVRGKYLIDWDD